MSTSQLILRITPLTFSSHPLHLSFLLRYHALLSTSLVISSSWLTSKLNPLFDHPSNSLFSSNWLHRPSSLHQKYSRLPTHSQPSLEDLLSCYNSTLSNLLNIHAPLITKQSSHANNPWFTSYIQAFKSFRRHLEHVYKRTIDPASRAEALTNLKSATNRYHKLVIAAKQKYYSSLIHSSSSNPRRLWRAVNSLLHRKSPSPLPTSIPSPSIAHTFGSFFSDKMSSLRTTQQSPRASQSPTAAPPPTPTPPAPPSQSSLQILHPASETEVLLLLNSLPNKQCELDPIPPSLLKDCASVLLPVITQIINLSISYGHLA